MRPIVVGGLAASLLAAFSCSSDPSGSRAEGSPDASVDGSVGPSSFDSGKDGDAAPFVVPPCIVAGGDMAEGAQTLTDDTGSASVSVEGTGCKRMFTLTSTAFRNDTLPVSPRALQERDDRPSLQTTHPLFDALYQLAQDEASENSVASIKDYAFNDGKTLPCAAGGCFETGRKWSYVWTRDTAYATHLGLAWIDPIRARNSLEFKLSTRRDGSDLQIVQDTGTGGSYPLSSDRAVWALGAGELLLHLTGDARTEFRGKALEAAKNTIEHDRAVVFDARDGLYRGEQSFLDWREQSYPGWTASETVHIGMSKSLSTNVAHLSLIELAAQLADEISDTPTAMTMKARAADLRVAIRTRFWLEDVTQLSTFLTTELDPSPAHRFDLLGTSLAVLLDATTVDQSQKAIASYPTLPKGPPVIFPQQKETAIYHNRAIWPFVTAYWMRAAKKVGNDAAFDLGMHSLMRGAALNLSNMENLEVVTGKPYLEDGSYSGPVVNSQRQLWSVAGYVSAVHHGLFGVEPIRGGVRVTPFLPRTLAAKLFGKATRIALNNISLRGKKISIVVNLPAAKDGAGGAYVIASRRLNGEPLAGDVASDESLRERNLIEVDLAPPKNPSATVRRISDVADYRTIYGPRTPTITNVTLSGGKLVVSAEFAGEPPSDITWSVYRDGERVATGQDANVTTWTDTATSGDTSPSHCYAVETRFVTSGNHSQHSQPWCFWGPAVTRVLSIPATTFAVTGGTRVHAYGRDFAEAWGDPGHEIVADFVAMHTGPHLIQAVYGNGAGPTTTGITCGAKRLSVEELPSNAVVGGGILLMPQRGDWASWGDSSFVRATLTTGKSYRLRVTHDDRSVNMSAFQHFAAYTGGSGGKEGPLHRVNIAELKVLSLVP